ETRPLSPWRYIHRAHPPAAEIDPAKEREVLTGKSPAPCRFPDDGIVAARPIVGSCASNVHALQAELTGDLLADRILADVDRFVDGEPGGSRCPTAEPRPRIT